MFWAYIIIALAVVAGGVTVVETYNHALTSSSSANTRAASAEARAALASKHAHDQEELADDAGKFSSDAQTQLADRDRKIHGMEAQIVKLKAGDPKAHACEDTPVPPPTRQLRRDTFGAVSGELVLHPAPAAAANPGAAAAGRDVRAGEAGSGPGPVGAPLVQPGQGERAPVAGEAKPSTQSLRDRIRALMRK